MSIAASSRSDPAAGASRLDLLRFGDLVLLVLALPVFLLSDLPFEAYVVGGGAWIVQRLVQLALQRRAAASDDPRTVVGVAAASMILRGWLIAGAIFLVGLSNEDAGLAAAILVISLFTIYFAIQLALRPLDGMSPRP